MPREVTDDMVEAFVYTYNVRGEVWLGPNERERVRRAIAAALAAAPSGHGERG